MPDFFVKDVRNCLNTTECRRVNDDIKISFLEGGELSSFTLFLNDEQAENLVRLIQAALDEKKGQAS